MATQGQIDGLKKQIAERRETLNSLVPQILELLKKRGKKNENRRGDEKPRISLEDFAGFSFFLCELQSSMGGCYLDVGKLDHGGSTLILRIRQDGGIFEAGKDGWLKDGKVEEFKSEHMKTLTEVLAKRADIEAELDQKEAERVRLSSEEATRTEEYNSLLAEAEALYIFPATRTS